MQEYDAVQLLTATRPDPLSDLPAMDRENTQRSRSVTDDYPESMAGSVSTLSSHPTSPAFSYMSDQDHIPDSVDIMPHSRQTSFEFPNHDITDRTFQDKAHLPKLMSSGRPHSLNLPLRIRKDSPTEEKTNRHLKRATTYIDRAFE